MSKGFWFLFNWICFKLIREYLKDAMKTYMYKSRGPYLCDVTPPHGASLCEYGDEGSPLICNSHIPGNGTDKEQYIYGIADHVPNNCDIIEGRKKVLFVYMIRLV